jgi:hypothetical protein
METEFLDYDEVWEEGGYEMVSGDVEVTTTQLPGMWDTSTSLQSDVYFAYHYKRKLSESEASSRQLDALLYVMSSAMGIWGSEDDEDL